MRECQGCGEPFEESRWWQTFHSKECQQAFHKRRYRAEAKLNGHGLGAEEEREAARQALAALNQSLSERLAEQAQPLRRRW